MPRKRGGPRLSDGERLRLEEIGKNLERLRENAGFEAQDELARATAIDSGSISEYARGVRQMGILRAEALARAMGRTVNDLLGVEDEMKVIDPYPNRRRVREWACYSKLPKDVRDEIESMTGGDLPNEWEWCTEIARALARRARRDTDVASTKRAKQ